MPSRKVALLIIACLIAVGAVSFVVYANKPETSDTYDSSLVRGVDSADLIDNSLRKSSDQDDDADGLFNWEEVLWKTDPKNPDTDGDLMPDGEEVKMGRNPAVKGPNDQLITPTSKSADTTKASQPKKVMNETDKLAATLFNEYLQYKKSGIPIDSQAQEKIIENALVSNQLKVSAPQYKPGEIKVTSENSPESLRLYGNSLGASIKRNSPVQEDNEYAILMKAIANENPAELKKLDPLIAGYKNLVNELLNQNIPSKFLQSHIKLLNNLSILAVVVENMRFYFEDPYRGLTGYMYYSQTLLQIADSLKETNKILNNEGIIFTEEEHGRVFSGII